MFTLIFRRRCPGDYKIVQYRKNNSASVKEAIQAKHAVDEIGGVVDKIHATLSNLRKESECSK